jgi:hypothetical protein
MMRGFGRRCNKLLAYGIPPIGKLTLFGCHEAKFVGCSTPSDRMK